jgi:hypothetical protein
LLGGLPLALVITGRLLAGRPELTVVVLRNALHHRGAISVLSERGQILPDYHHKIGSSFRAVLSEIWDALPEAEPDLRRRVLTALALFGENASVPEDVLPLMLELPVADPDDIDPPPLEQALARLEAAQLVERNWERRQLRLHPLIQFFAQQRQELGTPARVLERVKHELNSARSILALPVGHLSEAVRALEILSKLDSGSGAAGGVVDLCRMLRVEAHAVSLTAYTSSGAVDPAQLAYAAALHGQAALKEAAEQTARAKGAPHLELRWTTAEAGRSLRYRLHGHEGSVFGCAVNADGRTGLSASSDGTLIVWDLTTGEHRHRLRGHRGWVWGCSVSADGRTGLSASDDKTLIVWDLVTGEERHRLRGQEGGVVGPAISGDGCTGLSPSDDKTLIVWDLANGEERHCMRDHEGGVVGFASHPIPLYRPQLCYPRARPQTRTFSEPALP